MSTAHKRTKMQREADLVQTAAWNLHGVEQTEIARRLGVSVRQIEYDMADIRKRWRAAQIGSEEERRERAAARLEDLIAVYWRRFEASMTPRTITSTKEAIRPAVQMGPISMPGSRSTETTTRVEESHGDPAYLAGVERCLAQLRALLCLDKQPDLTGVEDLLVRRYIGVANIEAI